MLRTTTQWYRMEKIMSLLNDEEQEIATALKSAELSDLAGDDINMDKLGFKSGAISKEGAETHTLMTDINQVAYKVMKNKASDLSKAKAKMNDVAQRYGRDNKSYDEAQNSYDSALVESQDAELRHTLTKGTKEQIGQAVVRGMTF